MNAIREIEAFLAKEGARMLSCKQEAGRVFRVAYEIGGCRYQVRMKNPAKTDWASKKSMLSGVRSNTRRAA